MIPSKRRCSESGSVFDSSVFRPSALSILASVSACYFVGLQYATTQLRVPKARQHPLRRRLRATNWRQETFALPQDLHNDLPQKVSRNLLEDLSSEESWRRLGQYAGLSISTRPVCNMTPSMDHLPSSALDSFRKQMLNEGYIKLHKRCLHQGCRDHLSSLSSLIDHLDEVGLHPQFVLLFDEVWQAVHQLTVALEPIFGLQNVMDFFVFNIKPGKSGWGLHRDRSGSAKFQPDGMPSYTTVWLAITDASQQNSCIHFLPASADPGYSAVYKDEVGRIIDDHDIVVGNRQHVRALPAKSGTALVWSHRLLHWGSRSLPNSTVSRKTLSFAMADPCFEKPLIELSAGELPSFEARLALVAYTLICYHHSQPVQGSLQTTLVDLVWEHKEYLTKAAFTRQSTKNSFMDNLISLCLEGDDRLVTRVGEIGEYVMHKFGEGDAEWDDEEPVSLDGDN